MVFINRNFCKSFQSILNSSSYVILSSQECSEATLIFYSSSSTDWVDVKDPNNPSVPFRIVANKYFTFRGLTDSSQLSAIAYTGNPILYYRTQFYGSMTDL
jgi:hypothetical protein